jgi:hypothetical protein
MGIGKSSSTISPIKTTVANTFNSTLAGKAEIRKRKKMISLGYESPQDSRGRFSASPCTSRLPY